MMQRALVLAMSILAAGQLARAQVAIDWNQDTRGVAVAVDGQRQVFTVDYEYNPAGDITLTKRDAAGNLMWTAAHNQLDPTKWEKAAWVATDSQGNAVVCGTLMSGYSNPVNAASLVMKFSALGQLQWRQVYDSDFDGSSTRKCLVDAQDNIYVLGLGQGSAGMTTRVRKFAPDGSILWTWQDLAGIGAPQNLKFTPEGALLVIARGTVGSVNGFAKVDVDGNQLWSVPGVNSVSLGDAAGDGLGNTYLVHGDYVFNGGTVLRKLDPAGVTQWSVVHPFGGTRVEVGGDNLPLIAGSATYSSAGAAFMKCAANGAILWSNLNADGPLMLLTQSQLLLDGANNAYLAAASYGAGMEMALCKVNADGSTGWTLTMPSGGAVAMARDNQDSILLVGGRTAKIRQAFPAPELRYVWGPSCGSRLEWDPVPGAVDYRVWSSSGLGAAWEEIGVTSQNNWSLPCELPGQALFRVSARN